MEIQSGIITELEARHHKKEMDIKRKIDELSAVIIQTEGISDKASEVIQCLKDEREETEEAYRYQIGRFKAYMKTKRELEEEAEKGPISYEDALRYIEKRAIEAFFDD